MLRKKYFVAVTTLTLTWLFSCVPLSVAYAEVQSSTSNDPIMDHSSVSISERNDTDRILPRVVGGEIKNRKVNVKTTYEWSGYARVSDNLKTGNAGGSITSNKTVSYQTSATGYIQGLQFSFNTTVTSSIGYTLHVGANKRVYMAYRVKYKVERGTNQLIDTVTGKVLKSQSYTIKIPQYGEYSLRNY